MFIVEVGANMDSYPLNYYEFFVKFNEGDYYTCHDLLEEIWLTERDNLFVKGLLQLSVALYHYSYGNVKGTRDMMHVAYRYLKRYSPEMWGLNVDFVLHYIQECLPIIPQDIDRVPYNQCSSLPQLPIIYLNIE